ncbi:MAG: ferrous iron transporter B [Firmicutes bacterium]|nr:ferrous iron transporter B [Bacillota bacterium]
MLTGIIVFGLIMTFAASKLLSATVLKGAPSSFTLELPPYRKPKLSQILVRSLLDRTVFVLGRAVMVAAPAGVIIWIFANVDLNGTSLISHFVEFLDPLGMMMGLSGAVLAGFILGFPANEIVLPIIVMCYVSSGTLMPIDGYSELAPLLYANGWNMLTAFNMLIFSLLHWPCSTTVLTIKKETGSLKWTFLSIALPTFLGMAICILTNFLFG